MTAFFILGWIVCAFLAFYFFQRAFRKTYDFTESDFIICAILSFVFGPMGLGAALISTFLTWLDERPERVIWKKYN